MNELDQNSIIIAALLGLPLLMLFANNAVRWVGVGWAFGIVAMFVMAFRSDILLEQESNYVCDDCLENLKKQRRKRR